MDPFSTIITGTNILTSTFTPTIPTSFQINDPINLPSAPIDLNNAEVSSLTLSGELTVSANPGSSITVRGQHSEVSSLAGCTENPVMTY